MLKLRLSDISVIATREAKQMIRNDRRVDAIKRVQADLGNRCGLKQAWDFVKKLETEINQEDEHRRLGKR